MSVFWLGFLGALVAPFLEVWGLRRQAPKDWPRYLRSWSFWGLTAAMAVAGGAVALGYRIIYPDSQPGTLMYLQIGASTPLILSALLTKASSIVDDPGGAGIRL